jgi:hypothetical protein
MPRRGLDRAACNRMVHAAAVAILESFSPPPDPVARWAWERRRTRWWKREHMGREARIFGAKRKPTGMTRGRLAVARNAECGAALEG